MLARLCSVALVIGILWFLCFCAPFVLSWIVVGVEIHGYVYPWEAIDTGHSDCGVEESAKMFLPPTKPTTTPCFTLYLIPPCHVSI
jgi:hypothetical protein